MAYFILHNSYSPAAKTALDVSDDTSRHAYHDSQRLTNAYIKAGTAIILGAPLVAATTAAVTKSPEMAANNLTLFNLGITIYLSRAIEEVRQKLHYFRENYALSEGGFTERDRKLTDNLKRAVLSNKPTLGDYFRKAKQYPFTSATGVAGTALALATRSPALGTLCMSVFMVTMAAEESAMLDRIHEQASKSRKMIQVCNKMRLF